MAYNAGAIVTNFTAGIKDFKTGIKRVKSELSGFSKSVSKTGAKLKSAGTKMSTHITAPLAAIGAAAGKFGIQFENSMTKSLSIMGDVSNEMKTQMEETAREVALSTDKSAKQAANSYYYLASAGMDAKESMEALPKVAEFATAGQFDMATATDLLTDAQSALGLASEDTAEHMKNMQKVSDVLTQAQNMANASTKQFSEALTNKAGAALKSTNKDIEEGAAVLSVLADQGKKGSEAGNMLSRTLNYLVDAQQKNNDVWKSEGMNVYDEQTGEMKNMADIVEMLEGKMEGLSTQEKDNMLRKLGFNAETRSTIKLLMGTSEQMREYEADLRNAGGATEEVANKQMESMKKQLGLLKDGLIDAALSIYDMLKPAIKNVLLPTLQDVVKNIRQVANWFGNLSSPVQEFIGIAAALVTALGPILMGIGTFLTMIGPVITAVSTVGSAIAALGAGPLVAIVAAVAGAIAIFIKWRKEIMNFAKYLFNVFIGTFLKLPKYFPQIWNDIKNITNRGLKSLGNLISNLLSKITNIFQTSWNAVKRVTSKTWNGIKTVVSKYLDMITNVLLNWTIPGIIIKYWDEIWNYTKKIWNKVSNFISETWTKLINTIKNSKFVKILSDTFLKMKNNITETFITMKNKIVNAWNLVTSTVTNSQIWQSAVSIFQNFIDKFMTGFNRIPKLVSSAWNSVIDFTFDAFTNVANDMKSMFNTVVDWVPEKIGEIVGGIKNFWTDAYEYLSNQDLYSVGKNIIGSLADGVKAAMDRVVSSVTDVAKGLSDAAKKALGISSPSKVFAEIGANIGQGMQEGIESEEESLEAKMSTIKDKLTASINVSQAEINPQAKNAAGNISNSEVYNDFRPTVNLSGNNSNTASDERRQMEQLLRKLGAQYNAK